MKNNECFDCLNHGEGKFAENTGWYHPCKFGIKNEGMKEVEKCPKFLPNKGFQIGGYYSFTHFEFSKDVPNECMELFFHSNGEFPKDDEEEFIQFHICDFTQLESWVKYWGKYLRKVGAVNDDDE